MKKWSSILLLIVIVTACQKADLSPNAGRASIQNKSYPAEKAMKQGDVVNIHGKISNKDRWDQFVESMQSHKAAKVRITGYTTEGDPIFYDLAYDGKLISYQFDNSMDAFAGSGKGKQSTTCKGIEEKQGEQGTRFSLSGCDSQVGLSFVFTTPKDSQ